MTVPEKSTNQLAVWRELIDALQQLNGAWNGTHTSGVHTTAGTQLPANIAAALASALGLATTTLAEAAAVLAAQQDSGTRYRSLAGALRGVADDWPRTN